MIKIDMEMPENCMECPMCNEHIWCHAPVAGLGFGESDVAMHLSDRPDWCPMKDEHAVCMNCAFQPTRPTWQQGKAYCGQCGKRIPLKIKAKYCHKCGREILWI